MFIRYFIYFISVTLALSSCLKGDEQDLLEYVDDGMYIKGASTGFYYLGTKAMMKQAINEVNGQPRTGFFEVYIAVSSESEGFNIIEVVNHKATVYGPVSRRSITLNGENGQIEGTIEKGIFGSDAGLFTVPKSGIYHIIIDKQTETFILSPVTDLSLFGNVRGDVWSDTEIPLVNGFDKANMMFQVGDLELREGEFRIRYGRGDKIEVVGNEVKISTFFGGELFRNNNSYELSVIPGGNNYFFNNGQEGIYTITANWTVGEGFSISISSTDSVYPEKLFLIGDGISILSGEEAWAWDLNDFEMILVRGKTNLFWKIVWLNSSGAIRFSPQKTWDDDFGKEERLADDLYSIGDNNIPVPGKEGYYMIVVNFQLNQFTITRPEVYLIGEAVGGWNSRDPDAQLIVNDELKILWLAKYFTVGDIRMYAWHSRGWFTHWWNAEFNVYDGEIKYRGDSPNNEHIVLMPAYYFVYLNFITGEGAISLEKCDECA